MNDQGRRSDVQLNAYQQDLAERLRPVLERLDPAHVTGDSGLWIEKAGNSWALRLSVHARDERFPGLDLFASSDQCILGFAQSEQLECHSDPGSVEGLVDQVMELIQRYLAGVTVVELKDSRGRVIRRDFFYGLDADGSVGTRIGTSKRLFSFRKAKESAILSFRFLKDWEAA